MHKIAVATMHNYTRLHKCESHGISTRGITQDVSIPHYEKRGPHEHVTRFVLPVSCYHAFPCMEK